MTSQNDTKTIWSETFGSLGVHDSQETRITTDVATQVDVETEVDLATEVNLATGADLATQLNKGPEHPEAEDESDDDEPCFTSLLASFMPLTPPQIILDLNAVAEIAKLVNFHDLKSMRLVNKDWSAAATPILAKRSNVAGGRQISTYSSN